MKFKPIPPQEAVAKAAAQHGGRLAAIVGTGDAIHKVPVGARVRAAGVRVADLNEAAKAPAVVGAPKRPSKAAKVSGGPATMSGEEMADALRAELADVAAQRFLRVWFVPPALVVDFANLPPGADPAALRAASPRLKLVVRRQRAIGGLVEDSPEMSVSASVSSPAGLFRTKTGLPRELVGYIARALRKLVAESSAAVVGVAVGGKRRHGQPAKRKRWSIASILRQYRRRAGRR